MPHNGATLTATAQGSDLHIQESGLICYENGGQSCIMYVFPDSNPQHVLISSRDFTLPEPVSASGVFTKGQAEDGTVDFVIAGVVIGPGSVSVDEYDSIRDKWLHGVASDTF